MLRKRFKPNKKARSIQQKARLPNDWTQGKEMTPDGCRGSFHVPGCIACCYGRWPIQRGECNHSRVGATFTVVPCCNHEWLRDKEKRPEKSDPTPLSYHNLLFKSTGKCCREYKICALHKNKCLYLGNIPSWKVRKSMISYRHKEEIPKR